MSSGGEVSDTVAGILSRPFFTPVSRVRPGGEDNPTGANVMMRHNKPCFHTPLQHVLKIPEFGEMCLNVPECRGVIYCLVQFDKGNKSVRV